MGQLEQQLEQKVAFLDNGGGFGCSNAVEQHDREFELLKFKIARRDNYKISMLSAAIGVLIGSLVTVISVLI